MGARNLTRRWLYRADRVGSGRLTGREPRTARTGGVTRTGNAAWLLGWGSVGTAYFRIYADDEGESHSEDVALAFQQDDFVPPAPPVLMSSFEPATQYGFERVHPGWNGDWHRAPNRVLAIYLSGEGQMEASDGEVRALHRAQSCWLKTQPARATSASHQPRRDARRHRVCYLINRTS